MKRSLILRRYFLKVLGLHEWGLMQMACVGGAENFQMCPVCKNVSSMNWVGGGYLCPECEQTHYSV